MFWRTMLPPSSGQSAWSQEMDLDVGAGSRRGRDMCEPIGKWVKAVHERATGWEREEA